MYFHNAITINIDYLKICMIFFLVKMSGNGMKSDVLLRYAGLLFKLNMVLVCYIDFYKAISEDWLQYDLIFP